MVLDQRNAGASVTPVNNGYVLDRWKFGLTQASKFTAQQDAGAVTPPTGFTDYLGITSSSAYSVISTDTFFLDQVIEGYNVGDLNWGSASAKTITLSFWVRSSLTGQFGGALRNSAANRAYPFSFTISAANTWEQKSITIAGDTTGTWLTTNGTGIEVVWNLGSGSTYLATAGAWTAANIIGSTGDTSLVGTNGATFYITGVQLEVGTQATSFEYRQYTTELQLCQRYFISYGGSNAYESVAVGYNSSTTNAIGKTFLPVEMRTAPTVFASANLGIYDGAAVVAVTSVSVDQPSSKVFNANYITASGLTTFRPIGVIGNNSTAARLQLSSEL
jgi:hypothetical protein